MRESDSKLIGRKYDAGAAFVVTAEKIAAFCDAAKSSWAGSWTSTRRRYKQPKQ